MASQNKDAPPAYQEIAGQQGGKWLTNACFIFITKWMMIDIFEYKMDVGNNTLMWSETRNFVRKEFAKPYRYFQTYTIRAVTSVYQSHIKDIDSPDLDLRMGFVT